MYIPDSASAALVAMVLDVCPAGLAPGVRTTAGAVVDACIFPEGKEGSERSSGSIWSSKGVETVVAIVA